MINLKSLKFSFPKLLSILFFILLLGAYANIFAIGSPYAPGAILDPACVPGEVNCTVSIISSQWTTTGSDVYYNTGKVGVSNTNPLVKFHVGSGEAVDLSTYTPTLLVQNNPFDGYYAIVDIISGRAGKTMINLGDKDNHMIGSIIYQNNIVDSSDYMSFLIGGNDNRMVINSNGNVSIAGNNLVTGSVGIGTITPLQKLDITGGSFRLDNTTGATPTGIVYKGALPFISDFNYGNNGIVTTVGFNTFVGINAGNLTMGSTATSTSHSSYNTAMGNGALKTNTIGYNNTANGFNALSLNTTGYLNTATGFSSLDSNTTGSSNTASGGYALHLNTTGVQNTANGAYALYSDTTGNQNTANGYSALYSNTTGYYNSAIGVNSIYSNTTGYQNTGNGMQSLYANTTGHSNTATGYGSLDSNTTGNYNTANGMISLSSNTTGIQNTATGYGSLDSNITGNYNTANGVQSLHFNTTGIQNTAIGTQALYDIGSTQTAGAFNVGTSYTIASIGTTNFTLIGAASNTIGVVFTATGAGTGTGTATPNATSNNTALGYNTGRGIIYGTGNTILGANVTGLSAGLTNNIIIADSAGNQRINVDNLGNVGIGIVTPLNTLHVTGTPATGTHTARIANTLGGVTQNNGLLVLAGNNTGVAASEMITFQRPDATVIGSISQNAATTIAFNTSSDRRIKQNIQDTSYGLTDLMKITVSDFTFINDPNQKKMTGFIAQDLNNIFPDAVTTNGDDGTISLSQGQTPWMIDYSKLTPLIVKSIQEMELRVTGINDLEVDNIWRDNLISWFGNATNGISEFVTGTVRAKDKICINDTCVTEEQLKILLQNSANITSNQTSNTNTDTAINTDTTSDSSSSANSIPVCTSTQTLIDNICVDNKKEEPLSCTSPQILVDNICVDPVVIIPTCTDSQTLVDNVCIDVVDEEAIN
jgi:hypothetical protein